jgi:hypothetical protein
MTSVYVKCDSCSATLDRYALADDPHTSDGTFRNNYNEAERYAAKLNWAVVGSDIHFCPSCLPPGDWVFERFGDDTIICACPDHQPRIFKNGKLEILKPLPAHMISF